MCRTSGAYPERLEGSTSANNLQATCWSCVGANSVSQKTCTLWPLCTPWLNRAVHIFGFTCTVTVQTPRGEQTAASVLRLHRGSSLSGSGGSQRSSGPVYSKLLSGLQCVPLCLWLSGGFRGHKHAHTHTYTVYLIPCDRSAVRGAEESSDSKMSGRTVASHDPGLFVVLCGVQSADAPPPSITEWPNVRTLWLLTVMSFHLLVIYHVGKASR